MAKPPGKRISDEVREAILADVRAGGMSVRAIAERHDVSRSTVSTYAKAAGLHGGFDRTRTAAATQARQVDLAARRAVLKARLLDEAEQLLDQIHRPHIVFNIGGRDNCYTEHLMEAPPTGDIRNLMQAASTAMQRHMDLERLDHDREDDEATSLIGQLAAGFDAAYRELKARETADDHAEP